MAMVFNCPVVKLGDGQLSPNELFAHGGILAVIDPGSCSAAAVYGESSATGAAMVGRNFDWHDVPGLSQRHNVQVYVNDDATDGIVGIGFLGQLFPSSI